MRRNVLLPALSNGSDMEVAYVVSISVQQAHSQPEGGENF